MIFNLKILDFVRLAVKQLTVSLTNALFGRLLPATMTALVVLPVD